MTLTPQSRFPSGVRTGMMPSVRLEVTVHPPQRGNYLYSIGTLRPVAEIKDAQGKPLYKHYPKYFHDTPVGEDAYLLALNGSAVGEMIQRSKDEEWELSDLLDKEHHVHFTNPERVAFIEVIETNPALDYRAVITPLLQKLEEEELFDTHLMFIPPHKERIISLFRTHNFVRAGQLYSPDIDAALYVYQKPQPKQDLLTH
jgi:hypothetical protein